MWKQSTTRVTALAQKLEFCQDTLTRSCFWKGLYTTGREDEGLRVYKYLQIFLVLVDVVELEHVRVFNELQDSNFPLHLRGQGHEKGSA